VVECPNGIKVCGMECPDSCPAPSSG
jgi:hypothetical protein